MKTAKQWQKDLNLDGLPDAELLELLNVAEGMQAAPFTAAEVLAAGLATELNPYTLEEEFKEYGKAKRYASPLRDLPLWELKAYLRGGKKGWARVYFFWSIDESAFICGAELKGGKAPSQQVLKQALSVCIRQLKLGTL